MRKPSFSLWSPAWQPAGLAQLGGHLELHLHRGSQGLFSPNFSSVCKRKTKRKEKKRKQSLSSYHITWARSQWLPHLWPAGTEDSLLLEWSALSGMLYNHGTKRGWMWLRGLQLGMRSQGWISSYHFHIVSCWLAQGGCITCLRSHSSMQSIGFKLRDAGIPESEVCLNLFFIL